MGYTSELITDVAMVDINLAISGLSALNNEGPPENSLNGEVVEWAGYLCSFTRYVHLNTWTDCESIRRVSKDFVPEFRRAGEALKDLLGRREEFGFSPRQAKKLTCYMENIIARQKNLDNNYCKGLNSAFDPGVEYPLRSG